MLILRLQITRALNALVQRVRRYAAVLRPPPPHSQRSPLPPDVAEAAAWLDALQSGRLHPPRDVHDAVGWDTYWKNHLGVGLMEQAFADMMSSDQGLAEALAARDARTILCAGNGMSGEALALALFGFDVTALDISAVPGDVMVSAFRQQDHPLQSISGFSVNDSNVVTWDDAAAIAPEVRPPIHRTDTPPQRSGGRLSFLTGDLTDPDICPGPFDVVIERRTVQLFPEKERVDALRQLVGRLARRGVFVSQQHAGAWRPHQPRDHYAEEWLKANGFVLTHPRSPTERIEADRLARLMFSTG